MILHNHTIAENGDIIFDGKYNMSTLHLYTPEELQHIRDNAGIWAVLNNSMSGSQKVMMNSLYGATANEWYYFANIESADDITAEGRFYIKESEKILQNYLVNDWHLDKELHAHLKSLDVLKNSFDNLDPNAPVTQLDIEDYIVYMDTDSMYVTFEKLFNSIGFDPYKEGVYSEFIMEMNKFRLFDLFKDKLGAIIDSRHGENFLVFDLESVAEITVWVAKKKYVMSYKMEDGKIYDDALQHIKGKGIELAQSSMSAPVKEMIKFMIIQLFKGKLDSRNYKTYMRYLYKQFCDLPFQDRCTFSGINKYSDYITNDTTAVEFKPRTGASILGMANYNYDVKNKGLMTKYELLKGGKVAWYYTEDAEKKSYAFPIGDLPDELIEENPMNNIMQFMKQVGNPIARIVSRADINTVDPLANEMVIEI